MLVNVIRKELYVYISSYVREVLTRVPNTKFPITKFPSYKSYKIPKQLGSQLQSSHVTKSPSHSRLVTKLSSCKILHCQKIPNSSKIPKLLTSQLQSFKSYNILIVTLIFILSFEYDNFSVQTSDLPANKEKSGNKTVKIVQHFF